MQGVEEHNASQMDEGRYRLLVEAISDYAIHMLDAEGIVTSWNSGAQRSIGYHPAEIIGQHFSRFYTPEDCEKGLPALALATAAQEGRFEEEGWRLHKDGTRFWTHVIIDAIYGHDRQVIGYAQVTRDLTERKLAAAKLARSEEQFRLLVQSVTDYAIYMLDPAGNIASWNAGAQRIKGYAASEVIGRHFSLFFGDEERARGEPARNLEVAAREGRFENEGWRVRKDGSRFWASVVVDAIRDDMGNLLGFAKVTRDFTERLAAQHALERAREALFQSQKLEAVGQLTGGVAHDFNNLLMVISSSLDLIGKRLPDDEKLQALLRNAALAAQRGAALTQRMLAFARRQDLDRKPVDLPVLVRDMSELLQRSLGPAIRIETRFPLALRRVHTDANQLETALLNLVVNARDAMPEGGPLIIAAREESIAKEHPTGLPKGHYVCFSVTDEGEGMDEETLSRAAEPFFTTKGVGKGTGLGLSMVQGFAEQSGGRLVIESKKGQGTKVSIWLPIAKINDNPEPAAEAAEDIPAAIPRLAVLAVDDDALVLMNTTAMLEDMGHTVTAAASGSEALDILRQRSFDVVITDQAMPSMTGVQLAAAIKSHWAALPVILATGYAEIPEGSGTDLPKLSKPFTQRQLAEAMNDAVVR